MEQNNHTDMEAPRHVPTPEEIARAEAEAVRALQRGETLPRPAAAPAPPETAEAPAEAAPAWNDVPYVDDVPAPAEADDDDKPYEPSELEKKIAAIPEKQWVLYQTLGGAVLGLAAIGLLLLGSSELGTWALVLAAVLAMVVPRYLERWGGRKMPRARIAMLIAMLVTLIVAVVINGMRNGFQIIDPK